MQYGSADTNQSNPFHLLSMHMHSCIQAQIHYNAVRIQLTMSILQQFRAETQKGYGQRLFPTCFTPTISSLQTSHTNLLHQTLLSGHTYSLAALLLTCNACN